MEDGGGDCFYEAVPDDFGSKARGRATAAVPWRH
jgi:hypothetical protein